MTINQPSTAVRRMVVAAIVVLAGFALILSGAIWEPLGESLRTFLPRFGSPAWATLMAAMIFLGPFLLVGTGLILFPIRLDPGTKGAEPQKTEPLDL